MKYPLKSIHSFKDLRKHSLCLDYIDTNCLNTIEKQMFDLLIYENHMERHNRDKFGCNRTMMIIEAKARVLKFNWSIASGNLTFDMISGKE